MTILNIDELKDTFQDCNLNFLIGSGMSAPYLLTLGNLEVLLTKIDSNDDLSITQKKIIKASLYKKYSDGVIINNINVLENHKDANEVLYNYKNFLKSVNSILLNRKSTILSKQINVFTTNIDIFFEKALESMNVEYNDGFNGRFNPLFDTGNFKKSYFKKSLHYDNTSELPVFNLMKIHGSLTWKKENEKISFSDNLNIVRAISEIKIKNDALVDINKVEKEKKNDDDAYTINIEDLIVAVNSENVDESIDQFLAEYEKLSIVNPTKEKFKDTVLNQTYYELLRIFSNELEKENTILFVMGFSFADEHIRKVAVRAANSNPTLIIYIFAYTAEAKLSIGGEIEKSNPNNNNIKIYAPEDLRDECDGNKKKEMELNFRTINEKILNKLLEKVGEKSEQKGEVE